MSWCIDRALDVTAAGAPQMGLMARCCPTETGFHSDYEHCLAHETAADHHWGRLGSLGLAKSQQPAAATRCGEEADGTTN